MAIEPKDFGTLFRDSTTPAITTISASTCQGAGSVRETTGRPIPYRLLLTKVYTLRTRVVDYAYAELARLGLV